MYLKFSNLATDKSAVITPLHRATALLFFMKTSVLERGFISQIRALFQASIINLRHSKQKWVELLTPQTTILHEKIEQQKQNKGLAVLEQ